MRALAYQSNRVPPPAPFDKYRVCRSAIEWFAERAWLPGRGYRNEEIVLGPVSGVAGERAELIASVYRSVRIERLILHDSGLPGPKAGTTTDEILFNGNRILALPTSFSSHVVVTVKVSFHSNCQAWGVLTAKVYP